MTILMVPTGRTQLGRRSNQVIKKRWFSPERAKTTAFLMVGVMSGMPKTEDCEELLLKSLILAETTEIFTIGTFHKMDDWEKLLLNSLILAETTVIFVTGTFHKMDDWEELLLKSLIRAKTTVILLIGVFFIAEWLKKLLWKSPKSAISTAILFIVLLGSTCMG